MFRYSFSETIPIVLKVILSLSDRYKFFASGWLSIEVCQNALLSKIDIIMTTTKNFEINKFQIVGDLDLLLKIRYQELEVWCLANNIREK